MNKLILVVDDEPDLIKVVTFRLKKWGYKVRTAADGREALEMMREVKPDLLLLDLCLPTVDGGEVCSQIRSDEKLKDMSIVLFTADASSSVAEKAQALGADDYITKPFNPEELLAKVRRIMEKKHELFVG